MGMHLVILAVVVGGILAVAHPNRIGRFAEVVAQVVIAGAREAGLVGLEIGRLGLAPLEAGLVLLVVEARGPADFSEDAPGKDGTDAGDRLQRLGDGGHLRGNGGNLALQEGNVLH